MYWGVILKEDYNIYVLKNYEAIIEILSLEYKFNLRCIICFIINILVYLFLFKRNII